MIDDWRAWYFMLQPVLNDFMAAGFEAWKETRKRLQQLLSPNCPDLRNNEMLMRK